MAEALPSGQEDNYIPHFGVRDGELSNPSCADDRDAKIEELEEELHWLRGGWGIPDLSEIDDIGAEVVQRVEQMRYRIGAHARAVMTGRVGFQAD